MRRGIALIFIALALFGTPGMALPDAGPTAAGEGATACPQTRDEDARAYRVVMRTREYKELARGIAPGFKLVMLSPHNVIRVGGKCLVMVGVYVDHPDRLEARAHFGVDLRSYSVYVQDLEGDFKPTRRN